MRLRRAPRSYHAISGPLALGQSRGIAGKAARTFGHDVERREIVTPGDPQLVEAARGGQYPRLHGTHRAVVGGGGTPQGRAHLGDVTGQRPEAIVEVSAQLADP